MPLTILEATTAIDGDLVTEVIGLVTSVAKVFTIFPINVFLIGSLCGLGFTLFRKGKKAAR